MKESIGGISIFQIVIVFILLFAAIMSLTINHSKAFAVKDEIINILERESAASINNKKLSDSTIKEVVEALEKGGYRNVGSCPSDYIGYDRKGAEVTRNASFCVRPVLVSEEYEYTVKEVCKNNKCVISKGGFPTMVYYDIKLFYQLDIPIIRNILNFTVNGSTKVMFG